jgi:hypothetical protein
MTGHTGQPAKLCGIQPRGIEPGTRAQFILAAQRSGFVLAGRVVDHIADL